MVDTLPNLGYTFIANVCTKRPKIPPGTEEETKPRHYVQGPAKIKKQGRKGVIYFTKNGTKNIKRRFYNEKVCTITALSVGFRGGQSFRPMLLKKGSY